MKRWYIFFLSIIIVPNVTSMQNNNGSTRTVSGQRETDKKKKLFATLYRRRQSFDDGRRLSGADNLSDTDLATSPKSELTIVTLESLYGRSGKRGRRRSLPQEQTSSSLLQENEVQKKQEECEIQKKDEQKSTSMDYDRYFKICGVNPIIGAFLKAIITDQIVQVENGLNKITPEGARWIETIRWEKLQTQSPLGLAIAHGRVTIMQTLLNCKLTNQPDNLLHKSSAQSEVVELKELQPFFKVNKPDFFGSYPIHAIDPYARGEIFKPIFMALMENGARRNVRDPYGDTILQYGSSMRKC